MNKRSLTIPHDWPLAVREHATQALLDALGNGAFDYTPLPNNPDSFLCTVTVSTRDLRALRAALVPFGGEP